MSMVNFCIPIIGPNIEYVVQQIQEASLNADLLEFRLDLWNSNAINSLQFLKKYCKKPVIFTIRKKSQGGYFEGSEQVREHEILRLSSFEPDFFDLEYDISWYLLQEFSKKFPRIQLIISYHNLSNTPDDLEVVLNRMKRPFDVIYKIACHAHSTNDALRMLSCIRNHPGLLGICMGEKGQITRILGPLFGSPWTYSCLWEHQKSAPGQLTIEEMRSLYAIQRLNAESKIYGLIGGTISQSISHISHNKMFQECGINAIYVKMIVENKELELFFKLAKNLHIQGISVTTPHKESVLAFLDNIDPYAQRIKAINTIVNLDGKLWGYNTDGLGALDALEQHISVKEKILIILGAGGAARAIAFEAKHRGASITILNRNEKKAHKLAKDLDISYDDLINIPKIYDILINTLPNGSSLAIDKILANRIVMDINTVPKESFLLKEAKAKCCLLVFGHEMFLNQAIGQFTLWFPSMIQSIKISLKKHIANLID